MNISTTIAAVMLLTSQAIATERDRWDVKTYANNMVHAFASGEIGGTWLVLECKYGEINALIIVPDGIFNDGERVSVIANIDHNQPVRAIFWYSTGQLFTKIYKDDYSSIAPSKSIAIEAHGELGGRLSTSFRPGGERKLLMPLLRACPISSAREGGWGLHDPNRPEFP